MNTRPRWRLTEANRRRVYLWVSGLASVIQLAVGALLLGQPGASAHWPLLGALVCAGAWALLLTRRVPWRWVDYGVLLAATGLVLAQLLKVPPGGEVPAQLLFAGSFLFLAGFSTLPLPGALAYVLGVFAAYGVAVALRGGAVALLWELGLVGLLAAHLSTFGRAVSLERAEALAYARLALTDPLTGLPNRRAMMDRLQRAAQAGQGAAALLLDIDRFKAINDRLGHDAGDEVLREVAARLRRTLAGRGEAARWGGEEFLVLLSPGVPADALSAALQQAVRGAPMTGGVTVTLSLGGATLHEAPAVGDLLKLADARLYVAKAGGRDRAELHTPGLHELRALTLA
ncbi:GGDEF domain-containing protein [Deinococcus multiflagellatus]|uniref:GGDEF domain-containing protein n=1 Tax=Deinococcus multiflagellatus TaxID=1656887 RepID=UPI001CCB840A|nr:GGDEF domain-containing protein [Deinococcus multiflagellatus]MBZ9715745.1 GGDEF domain-containing protein [Deinococcus multiflagellatus]